MLAFLCVFFLSQTVQAIPTNLVGGVSPMATQIQGGSPHPFHNLILSDHGKVNSVKVGMYWPNAGDKQFNINVGEDCDMRAGSNYRSHKRFLAVEVNNVVVKYFDGNEACNGTLNDHTFNVSAASLQENFRDSTMYGVSVEFRWIGNTEAGNCNGGVNSCQPIRSYLANVAGGEGSRVRFRFNPLGSNARAGLIDTSNTTLGNTNNSMVTRSGGLQDFYFPFGLSCGEDAQLNDGLVSVYDADNGTDFQNPSLYFFVGTVNSSGGVTPLSRSEYSGYGSGAATNLNDIWVNETGTPRDRSGVSRGLRENTPGYPIFTPSNFYNAGGQTSVQIHRVQPHTKYVLVIRNQHAGQFTYIGLPGDAIFGSPDFECQVDPPGIRPYGSLNGTEFEAGTQVSPTAGVNNNSTDGVTASSRYTRELWYENGPSAGQAFDAGDVMIQRRGPNVRNYAPGNTTDTTAGSMGGGSWSFTIPGNTTHRQICQSVVLSNPVTPDGTTITPTGTHCAPIVRKPYINVQNGDVNTTCSNGTIKAFWNTTFANGSGTQLAVFGGSSIDQFVSAFGRTGPGPLKGLTFSNVGFSAYGRAFGGDVGDCSTNVVIPTGIPNSGNRTFATMQDAVDSPFYREGVLYINGNLTINGNFTYPAWGSFADMPYFKAAVTGNIYINSTASTINGVYSANGTIYTCTENGTPPATIATIANSCLGSTLTVNGALEATSIKYLRLRGSTAAVGQPAETIIYDPLIWLKAIKSSSVPVPGSTNFDAYTTMPPIL